MLTEPILLLETQDKTEPGTIPDALALLCNNSLRGFGGLAAHQRHAFDQFLWQAAAMALARSGNAKAAESETEWRNLADPGFWRQSLEALTPGCADTAWSLVVSDHTKPALFQPPIDGPFDQYKIAGRTPDEIDILITTKNHDLKSARALQARPLDWFLALMMLQTQQGYSGRGNFGIARMNGGFGSRPLVELTPGRDLPARFRHGLRSALLAGEKALNGSSGGYYCNDGLPLLWLSTWDNDNGLPLTDLDPLFVEVCRKIRLVRENGHIVAYARPTNAARVAVPKTAKGNLGDAWTPVAAKDQASLTVGPGGFDYRLTQRLIATSEFDRPASMRLSDNQTGAWWFHAAVLVRGQGKTEGFHERWLDVPAEVRAKFGEPVMADFAKDMTDDVAGVRKALATGLRAFLQGGPDKVDFEDERPRPWLDAFEHRIDNVFFDHLFARTAAAGDDAKEEATEKEWVQEAIRIGRELFDQALGNLTPPECRRERAHASSSLRFDGLLKPIKQKHGLYDDPRASEEEEAA